MQWFVEELDLENQKELGRLKEFLGGFNLEYEEDIECSKVIRKNGRIVATCSMSGKILKCFAVEEGLQGQGVSSLLVKSLEDSLFRKGIYDYFVFTKPENKKIFIALGYKLIEEVDEVVLMQGGFGSVEKYLKKLSKKLGETSGDRGCIVMNCNPFTLGHRYLIEKVSSEIDEVIIFVVEEDKSIFPFEDRKKLVTEGVKDLENVRVISGGDYIISSATFPTYFLKESGQVKEAYSNLDAKIFGRYFCKGLKMKKRFVGEEPLCKVTNNYNRVLKKTLVEYGVEVEEVPRKVDGKGVISASRARKVLASGEYGGIEELLPKVTLEYLKSDRGKRVVEELKKLKEMKIKEKY